MQSRRGSNGSSEVRDADRPAAIQASSAATSRRANGEGSIYQRKDSRWVGSISVGKGQRQHFLGHTRAKAAIYARDHGMN
jgi:hypothetical protein